MQRIAEQVESVQRGGGKADNKVMDHMHTFRRMVEVLSLNLEACFKNPQSHSERSEDVSNSLG